MITFTFGKLVVIFLLLFLLFGDITKIKKNSEAWLHSIGLKKNKNRKKGNLNPWPLVLETTVLPLNYSPFLVKMFTNYFLEIKNRLFLVGFLWVTVFITCYHYKEVILFLLIYNNSKLYSLNDVYFIFTNITDLFSMYFSLSYFVSNQIFVLVFSYHIVVFLSPGLFKFEYDLIKVGMFVGLIPFKIVH